MAVIAQVRADLTTLKSLVIDYIGLLTEGQCKIMQMRLLVGEASSSESQDRGGADEQTAIQEGGSGPGVAESANTRRL